MSEEYSERLLTDFSIGYAPILDAVPASTPVSLSGSPTIA